MPIRTVVSRGITAVNLPGRGRDRHRLPAARPTCHPSLGARKRDRRPELFEVDRERLLAPNHTRNLVRLPRKLGDSFKANGVAAGTVFQHEAPTILERLNVTSFRIVQPKRRILRNLVVSPLFVPGRERSICRVEGPIMTTEEACPPRDRGGCGQDRRKECHPSLPRQIAPSARNLARVA